jgi:type IV pilus assembly protein PilN
MIAVNLLRRTLVYEHRHRRKCLGEAAMLLLVVFGTVAIFGFIWNDLDHARAHLQKEKEYKVVQLEQLERTRDQLKIINHHNADLKNRHQAATDLMAQQQRSIQLLDTVSQSLDPLHIWLSRLEMKQDKVTLKGYADSKSQIVQLVQSLKHDDLFYDVRVLEAERVSGESFAYQFTMNLLLISEGNHVTSS